MRRTLNLRLLLGLIVVVASLALGVHVVHGYQEGRNALALLRRAERAESEGDAREAEKYLGRYLAHRPDDANALARYGLALASAGGSPRAWLRVVNILEIAIAQSRGDDDLVFRDARRKAADLSLSPDLARYKEARGHLEALLKLAPDDPALERQVGLTLEEEAKTVKTTEIRNLQELARDWYEKSIRHDPGQIEAYVSLGRLLRDGFRDPKAADVVMDRLVTGDPDRRRDPGAQGRAHLERARYRESYRLPDDGSDVETAWALAPDDPDVVLAAADRRAALGDDDVARSALEVGIAKHPADARFYLGLARLAATKRRTPEALAVLERGLAAIPDQPEILGAMAELRIDRWEEGDADATRAILTSLRRVPDIFKPAVDFLEGRLLLREGKLADGVAVLERSRALMASVPTFAAMAARADLILADCHERLGNPERRVEDYRRALALAPGSAEAHLGLGAALLAAGRPGLAREAYTAAADLVPAARVASARLALQELLTLPDADRDWEAMERAIDAAERAMPGSVEAVVLRAEYLAARGDFSQARDRLRRAIGADPSSLPLWISLANLSGRVGDVEEVLAVLDEARQKAGDSAPLRIAYAGYWSRRGGAGAKPALDRLGSDLSQFNDGDRRNIEDALAQANLRLGDVEVARNLWTRLADEAPDARPLSHLLDLVLSEGDAADPVAVEALAKRLRAVEGEDGSIWRYGESYRLFLLGIRGDERRFDDAMTGLVEAARRRPDWPLVPLLEGRIAERQGNAERAVDAYLRAIERGERDPQVIRRAVSLLNSRRRFDDAQRLVAKLAEDPAAGAALAKLDAEVALNRQDQDAALERARRAVPADSRDHLDQLWLAQLTWAAGRRLEAGEAFQRAIALAPAAPEAWAAYLDYLIRTRPDERPEALRGVTPADAMKEAAAKLTPDEAARLLTYGEAATGQVDRAEARQLKRLEAHPDDPALLLETAAFLVGIGKAANADALLDKLLAPESKATSLQKAAARRQRALILGARGGYPQLVRAVELIEENLADRPDSVEDLRLKALMTALQPGGRRDALQQFESLERVLPPTPEEKYLVARLYEDVGDWPKARAAYHSALAGKRENPIYQSMLARGLIMHGEAAEAAPLVESVEQLMPGSPAAAELRARLMIAEGRGDEADRLLIDFTKDNAPLLPKFAGMLEQLGRMEAAERLLRASAARPEDGAATLRLAEFLGRRGRASEALALCDAAWKTVDPAQVGLSSLRILFASPMSDELVQSVASRLDDASRRNPGLLSLRYDLANLYCRLGRYSEAEAIYREAHAKVPDAEGPLNNLAWLLAMTDGQNRGAEARQLIDRALALAGPIPELLDTSALVHVATGRPDLAILDLDAAIASGPSPDKYLHLAHARLLSNDRDACREALARSVDSGLDPRSLHPFDAKIYRYLTATLNRD